MDGGIFSFNGMFRSNRGNESNKAVAERNKTSLSKLFLMLHLLFVKIISIATLVDMTQAASMSTKRVACL